MSEIEEAKAVNTQEAVQEKEEAPAAEPLFAEAADDGMAPGRRKRRYVKVYESDSEDEEDDDDTKKQEKPKKVEGVAASDAKETKEKEDGATGVSPFVVAVGAAVGLGALFFV